MSIAAVNWAFAQDVPTTRKFVLVVLANYADEENTCYPGQKKIAEQIGASVETVRRALRELEAEGFVQRDRRTREGGWRTSDRYRLPVDEPTGQFEGTGQSEESADEPTGQSEGTLPVNLRVPTGQSEGAIVNPQLTQRVNPKTSPKPKASTKPTADEFLEWYLAYPRHEARGQAEKAYTKARQSVPADRLLAAAERYASDPNREKAFTKLPATWLNGKCWDDDPLPPKASKPPAFAGRGSVQEFD